MRPEIMSKKRQGKRRKFTSEYKAEVVRLCQQPGSTPFAVARELGLTASAVTNWVRQATVDAGGGGSGPLTTAEREELAALRRENRVLRQEREILKRATAFFAKEGTS
jgi:transposase